MSGRLAGKVVLISGTGSGQGRVAAQLFAQEGANVVGCDLDVAGADETVALVRAQGREMTSVAPVDLSNREDVTRWIEGAIAEHSGVDVLYNNAGSARFGSFPEMAREDFEFTMKNEFNVVWHSCQVAWPHLVKRGGGAIVNIASIAALIGTKTLLETAHSASKGAVLSFTRQLAAEGASVGIRANSISPGVITSPPVVRMLEADGPNGKLRGMIQATANGLPGEPRDVAYAALFLASDEARWITGSNLVVDGGTTVLV
jgi:meso-butanediol dehydrogenase / (S,S)-butanediol dehydrogenase / diacetyl reductase